MPEKIKESKELQKKKILVIDDEETFCELVKQGFERHGPFKVSTCSLASKAISTVQMVRPDLIFLDVQMPELSGPEIADLLKEDQELNKITIVFITGIVTEDELLDCGNMIGGKYYFAKPVKIAALIDLAKKLFNLN